MIVLITGSSGLIGQWVCSTLRDNAQIPVGLDLAENISSQKCPSFYQGSILDDERLRYVFDEVRPHAVIHLAARTDLNEKNDVSGYSANIDGVRNVLNCVKKTPSVQRVIITSSQLVCKLGYFPKDEKDYCPASMYAESKVLTEKVTRELDGGGKEWCLVRPTAVWGPGMSDQNLLKSICRRGFFHCGDKELYKFEGYVGNIAFQYFKLLVAPPERVHRQTFYLADYKPLSLRKYTNDLARYMKAPSIPTIPLPVTKLLALIGDGLNAVGLRNCPFNSLWLQNILTEYQFDMSKTRDICGDLPYTFEDGVKATAEWYMGLQS